MNGSMHGRRSGLPSHPRIRRTTRPRWYAATPIVLVASFFLVTGLAEAVPRIVHADTAITSLGLADVLFDPPLPPTPSGVEPAYPLNHTLDGDPTVLGQPQNADFEAAPQNFGSPPTNADLEGAATDVVTVPNGNFETGTFANWTLTGSPTIGSVRNFV